MSTLADFREVWCADFEFCAPDGERPDVICLVAHEIHSGRIVRLFDDELDAGPPWSTGFDVSFVAYYASAEIGCFLTLGWELPRRILDLFAEFRCLTNGLPTPCGSGLLGALTFFGLDAIDSADKDTMRQLAMRGGPFTSQERSDLLDYCESDVRGLVSLLPRMLPRIDLPRALLWGRYMAAAVRIEWAGIPVDVETLSRLRANWGRLKSKLIREVDRDYGVFIPVNSKTINPESPQGWAIIEAATQAGLEPERLAEAVDQIWRRERESTEEFFTAKREARRRTGLTPAKINRFEDMYQDHSVNPDFDVEARSIAAALPELGIRTGYRTEDGIDQVDYAAALWEMLRDPQDHCRSKTDSQILSMAVDLALSEPDDEFRALRFSASKFAEWLVRTDVPWPRLASGTLDLSDDAFRSMARQYPIVAPLRELRFALSQLRLNDLAVGSDGRNRCLLSAFRSTTGRNQPSNAKFIFGPSCWLRALIQPQPGRSIAYVDWEQQEFGIAAALSGDTAMREAYASGDPYLTFAKQAGAVPADATKETHKAQRDQFKVCALAVQYGMGERSLSVSIGKPEAYARELLRLHRQTYPKFWEWSQSAVDHAMLRGWLQTVFGWRVQVGAEANPRSLANFPMQANGAEMLRLACCMATEAGVTVCAPVHDAVLIEAATEHIDSEVERMQGFMQQASEIILNGFPLRTDAKIITHPNRYLDARGVAMWEHVSILLSVLPIKQKTEAVWF